MDKEYILSLLIEAIDIEDNICNEMSKLSDEDKNMLDRITTSILKAIGNILEIDYKTFRFDDVTDISCDTDLDISERVNKLMVLKEY